MQSVSARERLHALGPGIIAATSFGVGDAFAKVALAAGSDVLTLALCRGVVGVVILLCYLRIGVPPVPATPRERLIALGLGVLFAAIVFGLFKAIQLITVQIAVLTYFIYPLLTGIAGAIFGVERLSWRGLVAAIVAFFGLALMIGAYPRALPIVGLAFAIEAALCRTTFLLVARTALQKLDPRLTTWYSLLSSTAVFAIAAAATLNWQVPQTPYGWIAVLIVSVPPFGIASRAFTARLIITCSICPRSAFICPSAGSNSVTNAMSSLISRPSIFSTSSTTKFKLMTFGSSTCCRLKANNWAVSEAARLAALLTSLILL